MKKMKLAAGLSIALLGAMLGQQVLAQDPVVGTVDEALFTDSDPVKHKTNRQRCTSCANCCNVTNGVLPATG